LYYFRWRSLCLFPSAKFCVLLPVSRAYTVGRLLYLDILDYIVTLLIMAVGFSTWVAHIYLSGLKPRSAFCSG